MNDFDRGEDAKSTITLQDSDGNALDTAQFDRIWVKVFHKHLGVLIGTYNVGASTVTKESPTANGQISFTVPDTVTATAALGVYEYQIKTRDNDGDPMYGKFRGDCFRKVYDDGAVIYKYPGGG